MNNEITEETLEEGRVALYQLEKQLKERGNIILSDTVSEGSSNKLLASTQERKLLDQKPRVERLNQRLESLGLTIEELDDRGLLDGGGSLPSYNTSLKNKSRRTLELQSRSHRLQERGKETLSKLLNGLLHMIRTLMNKGLNLEDYFKQIDPNRRGLINRKKFFIMIKAIGLPFGNRELQDITQHYSVPSSDQADYISLLKDVGSIKLSTVKYSNLNSEDISTYTMVITDVKRMLLESISSLSKHQDDVYRMFARWDTQGTGTVTATQFLRVLARLHIHLSDQDQDFLVELLDTNGMGRIDFEGLLNYCFSGQSPASTHRSGINDTELLSPNIFSGGSLSVDDGKDGVETMSAVSTEGNNSIERIIGGNNLTNSRRPHTANISRPYAYNDRNLSSPYPPSATTSPQQHQYYQIGEHGIDNNVRVYMTSSINKSPQRPMTASGRVISTQNKKFQPIDGENSQYVVELPDDVIYGEEKYLSVDNTHISQQKKTQEKQRKESLPEDVPDMASFNDNTLVTDNQDEINFGEMKDSLPVVNSHHPRSAKWQQTKDITTNSNNPQYLQAKPIINSSSTTYNHNHNPIRIIKDTSQPVVEHINNSQPHKTTVYQVDNIKTTTMNAVHRSINHVPDVTTNHISNTIANAPLYRPNQQQNLNQNEPSDHLLLLATQILTTLREILTSRYRRGKSLQEIYGHFDRNDKQYFDANDFVIATSDLRIETSNRVASIAVNLIAIDGYDKVSFGEFKVFVLDSDHKLLELNIQEQLAQMLEQKGREYQSFMIDMFWNEEEDSNDIENVKLYRHQQDNEFISKNKFINSLQQIGLVLTSTEESRLVDRFDMHGNEMCCVTRFIRMIQNSRAWKHAERVLAFQDEAIEEATFLRQQLKLGHRRINEIDFSQLPEEVISMCEYLGIRVLSEHNMIWIAADALKAPLPISWTAQKDSNGRTYFYNHLTNQSKLEHPLDPHFRKLRDKYRQSPLDPHGGEETMHNSRDSIPSVIPLLHHSNPYDTPVAGINQTLNSINRPQLHNYPTNLPNNFHNNNNNRNINASNNQKRPQSAAEYHLPSSSKTTINNNSVKKSYQHVENPSQTSNLMNLKGLMGSAAFHNRPISAPQGNFNNECNTNENPIVKNKSNHHSGHNEKNKNTGIPSLEAIYKTGDGVGRYGIPTVRPRSSNNAIRASPVDRALNISNKYGVSAYFPTASHRTNNNNNNNTIDIKQVTTGNNKQIDSNSKQARLIEMLDGNIIEKLDQALGRR